MSSRQPSPTTITEYRRLKSLQGQLENQSDHFVDLNRKKKKRRPLMEIHISLQIKESSCSY